MRFRLNTRKATGVIVDRNKKMLLYKATKLGATVRYTFPLGGEGIQMIHVAVDVDTRAELLDIQW